MIVNNVICTVILVALNLNVFATPHYDSDLNKFIDEETEAKNYFAKILKSLVKLNEERVGNLKKLDVLNNYVSGKKPLRSYTSNDEDYYLIKSIRAILNDLNNNDNPLTNYIYRKQNPNIRKRKKFNIGLSLRQMANDSKSGRNINENSENKKSLSFKDDTKKLNNKILSSDSSLEYDTAKNTPMRHYYDYYCDNKRSRCRRACRRAYRYVCKTFVCAISFRAEMRRTCRRSCAKWFED